MRFTWVSVNAGTHFVSAEKEADASPEEETLAETQKETETAVITVVTPAVTTTQMQSSQQTTVQTSEQIATYPYNTEMVQTAPQKTYSVSMLMVENASELEKKFVCGYAPKAADFNIKAIYVCDSDHSDIYAVTGVQADIKCPALIQAGTNIFTITFDGISMPWTYECASISEADAAADGGSCSLPELTDCFYALMNDRRVSAGLTADVYSEKAHTQALKRAEVIAMEYRQTGTCTHTDAEEYCAGYGEIIQWGTPISIYKNMGVEKCAELIADCFKSSADHWNAWMWDYYNNDFDPDVRYSGAGIYYDAATGYIFVSVLYGYNG